MSLPGSSHRSGRHTFSAARHGAREATTYRFDKALNEGTVGYDRFGAVSRGPATAFSRGRDSSEHGT